MDIKIFTKLADLSSRPFSEQFTDEEINFILEHSRIKEGLVKYCIWKQHRHNGCYIFFAMDFMPFRVRKSGIDNSLEVVSTRKLTELEKLEQAQNYGTNSRIIEGYNYRDIENLIDEDLKYDVQTPEKFIKHCKRLGYSNPNYKAGSQMKLAI